MLSSRPLRRLNTRSVGASLAVLALAFLTFGAPNAAQAEGTYLQYSGGLSLVPNQNLNGYDRSGRGLSGRIESKGGYVIGVALGTTAYQQDKLKIRGEVAIDFRAVDVTSVGLSVGRYPSKARGDFNLFTAMLNGFVDYDFGAFAVPYVGLGIGYGRFDINAESSGARIIGFTKVQDVAGVFAWNVMAGLTIPVSDAVDFTIGYRYTATTDPNFNSSVVIPEGFVTRRVESQFDAHEEMLGLKIKF